MNEKIKSLAIQSGVVEAHVDWQAAGGDLLEKFAMLIIKECLKSVEEMYCKPRDHRTIYEDPYWEAYAERGVDSIEIIKDYFGVENEGGIRNTV